MTLVKASHEVAGKLSVLSEGGPVSYFTHVDVGRRPQFNRAANDMSAGNPESEQCEGERETETPQDRSCSVFSDLATEVTLHHFCNILLVTHVSPVQCDSWGASGTLTTIVFLSGQAKGCGGQRGHPAGHLFIHSSFNDHLC